MKPSEIIIKKLIEKGNKVGNRDWGNKYGEYLSGTITFTERAILDYLDELHAKGLLSPSTKDKE